MPKEEFTFEGVTNPEEFLEKLKSLLDSKNYVLGRGVLEAEGNIVKISFSWRPRRNDKLARVSKPPY